MAASVWPSDHGWPRFPVAGQVQRLRTRAQFQAVLAVRPVAHTAHFALHRCFLEGTPDRGWGIDKSLFLVGEASIGALVPKRWAKRAVTRNLLKRQIHQVSVLHENLFPRAAHVVRLRSAFDPRVFASAASSALRALAATELQQLIRLAASISDTDLHS
jgi:ribonuclease P protein component